MSDNTINLAIVGPADEGTACVRLSQPAPEGNLRQ